MSSRRSDSTIMLHNIFNPSINGKSIIYRPFTYNIQSYTKQMLIDFGPSDSDHIEDSSPASGLGVYLQVPCAQIRLNAVVTVGTFV